MVDLGVVISRTAFSRVLITAAIVALVVLLRALPLGEWLQGVEAWVDEHPAAGAAGYLGLTVVAVVAMTPGWIPMMLAGLLFGFTGGVVVALIGMTIGATAALVAGRTLARGWVEKRIAGNEQMLALDDALHTQAFTIVALTRVALVIPFNMLNYAYGLTRVKTGVYATATAVGMLPVVALYAYLGTLARDIGQILEGDAEIAPGNWWLAGIVLLAIVMVILIVRRAVGRALEQRTSLNMGRDETAA